jgi:hypothetical protein
VLCHATEKSYLNPYSPSQSKPSRHHGFRLGKEFGVKRFFDDVPLVGWVVTRWRSQAFVMKHPAAPQASVEL